MKSYISHCPANFGHWWLKYLFWNCPSHYLRQCWPRSLPPYGITRPQWVNPQKSLFYLASLLATTSLWNFVQVSNWIWTKLFLCIIMLSESCCSTVNDLTLLSILKMQSRAMPWDHIITQVLVSYCWRIWTWFVCAKTQGNGKWIHVKFWAVL